MEDGGRNGEDRADDPGRYMGALVMTAFGAGWLVTAWMGAARSVPLLVLITVIGCGLAGASLARFVGARRRASSSAAATGPRRKWLGFTLVVAAEAVAISWVASALARAGHEDWIAAGVILIVGLHFVPLARVFRYRPYALTGLALVVVGGVLPWILPAGPSSAWLEGDGQLCLRVVVAVDRPDQGLAFLPVELIHVVLL